jgi:hypothetical protein
LFPGRLSHLLNQPKGFCFKDISKLSPKMATTYRLIIAIEHALSNWPLVEYRKEEVRNRVIASTYESSVAR